MRNGLWLILVAVLTAPAAPGFAGGGQGQRFFDAGFELGARPGGRDLLARLSGSDSVPDEMLAGIVAGFVGRDRFSGLLAGVAETPEAAPADAAGEMPPSLPGSLSAVGSETFWIRLGDGAAPGVYMFADPACPHCASALEALALDISSGRLHVRLALAPVVSAGSRDLAAMIMLDQDPAQAAWSMLLGSARGVGLPHAAGAAAELGELGDALIAANLAWMSRNRLSAVPHFVWEQDGRWKQATGVQDASVFAAAGKFGNTGLSMHAPEAVQAMVDSETAPEPVPSLPN